MTDTQSHHLDDGNQPPDSADLVQMRLRRAYARANAVLSAALTGFGLTPQQWSVLAALRQHGAMSQNQLARRTAMDAATTHGVVLRLIARGHACRHPDALDRRRNIVDLTPQGREVVEVSAPVVSRAATQVLAPLTPAECASLAVLLERVVDGT